MKCRLIAVIFIALFALFLCSFTSALTASIGNARMVLKAEVGDTINKYVLVKNVNNESVNISLSVSGNLTKEIKLEDTDFILVSNEEKRAYFTIKPRKPGNYETRINVAFSPLRKGNGVILSSVVILNVYGKGELPENEEEDDTDISNDENDNAVGITGAATRKSLNALTILLPITTIILAIFLFLMIKKGKLKKKRSGRSS